MERESARDIATRMQRTPANVYRVRKEALRKLHRPERVVALVCQYVSEEEQPDSLLDYVRALHELHGYVPGWCGEESASECVAVLAMQMMKALNGRRAVEVLYSRDTLRKALPMLLNIPPRPELLKHE